MNQRSRIDRVLIASVTLVAIACGDTPEAVDAGACPAIAACGGDIVGSWTVRSLCFDSLDGLVMDLLGESDCAARVTDAHVGIRGTFDFDQDGGVVIDLTQTTDLRVTFSADCVWSAPDEHCTELRRDLYEGSEDDFYDVTCELQEGACACVLSGREQDYISHERYEARGAMLRQAGSESTYCVDGDKLRIRRTAAGVMGTFVLERD